MDMKNIGKIVSILLILASGISQIACTTKSNSGPTTTTITTNPKEENPPVEYTFDPSVPKAAKQATSLYQISEPSAFTDKLTLATLQGLVANHCEDQILILGGAYNNYKSYLRKNWNCSLQTKVDGNAITIPNLVAHYKDQLSGYILCAADSSSDSGNVAISLSGLLNAVVVTPENEKICNDLGLSCLLDVTNKNDTWLRNSE